MDENKKIHFFQVNHEELKSFFEKVGVVEKALGRTMNRQEREYLFHTMQLGKEIDLKDFGPGKRVLIIEHKEKE